MKIISLACASREFALATHKVIIKAADVAALAGAGPTALQIFPKTGTFPAGTVARFAGSNLITAFDSSDAAITSLLMSIGDGGSVQRLLTNTELHVDGTEVLYKVEAAATQPFAYVVADGIDATFTAAGGATPLLSETTVGEVEVYLWIGTMDDLERAQ